MDIRRRRGSIRKWFRLTCSELVKKKTESTINNLSINNPETSTNNQSDNESMIENEVAETANSEASNTKNDDMDQKNEN